jgi:hypothetical protein
MSGDRSGDRSGSGSGSGVTDNRYHGSYCRGNYVKVVKKTDFKQQRKQEGRRRW